MPVAKRASKAPATDRVALVVAGMHRSGTSAMARLLSLAGGKLPDRVMQPGPDNPLGFWEPWEVVALNDALLASVGSRWDDIFGHRVAGRIRPERDRFIADARRILAENYVDGDVMVLKDPRTSLAIDLWHEALSAEGWRPVYVVMVRNPLEVAASVEARSGAPVAATTLAWAAYMLAAERDTRDKTRVFVDYGALLDDWRGQLDRIGQAMGRPLPARATRVDAEIDSFLSPAHRNHRLDGMALSERTDLWSGVGETYRWLSEAATDGSPAPDVMDQAARDLDRVADVAEPALDALRREVAEFPAVQLALSDARKEVEALRTLCNQFHAEADHNGRHLEAARDQIAHILGELALARSEADILRADIGAAVTANHRIAQAEAATQRQRAQNAELAEALERERRLAAAHADHAKGVAEEMDRLRAVAEEAECMVLAERQRADDEAVRADRMAAARAAMLASLSWRITRPLRVLAKRLRGRETSGG